MDRYALYDLCVTEPVRLVRFLLAAHGNEPRVLREDFAGTGALCRGWVRDVPHGRAIAVDRDSEPLEHARGDRRIRCVTSDVRRCRARADIVAATNFSLGGWYTRPDLLRYLGHARACLSPRGIFVADLYGGAHSMQTGRYGREMVGPNGERVKYVFEHRKAHGSTGRVVNA